MPNTSNNNFSKFQEKTIHGP